MKEYMVTEDELKKYGVFDKIEKKELTHYLLLDDAVGYVESHMEPNLTPQGKAKLASKLFDLSEFICTGETEENWYQLAMKELGIRFKDEPKKNPESKKLVLNEKEMMLFRQGIIKFPNDESPEISEDEVALSRARTRGMVLCGNFTEIGKF